MNIAKGNHDQLGLSLQSKLAFLLAVSVFLWAIGTPMLFQRAHAANLTSISDTLTNSNPGSLSGHYIQFTSNVNITAGQTIKISLDKAPSLPGTSAFTEAYSAATSTDFMLQAGATTYAVVNSCTAGAQVSAVGNYNTGSDENLTLTVCAGNTITAGTPVAISIATSTASTKVWTNPATPQSYPITIGGTQTNQGETRVAIVNNVTLTATVNTTFTFTVTGLATTSTLNGGFVTTTGSTTATSLPFGTLASSTGSGILGQQLQVATNARNGFSVTVQENQPPTSSTGATIDLFANGATTSTPIPWVAPSAQLDVPSTYGHFGITTDDTTDGSTTPNEFNQGQSWAGNIDQPRVVFYHNGPSDGLTQNKGLARVAYRIQISDLQEAGNDYTNTITYVATPIF
jgi:hypothetical protein